MNDARTHGRGPAGALVAAVLMPPLALHLAAARQRDFWIATGLTALGFLPGVAFALHTLLSRRTAVAGG